MNIIDISWPISPLMTGYKDKRECEIITTKFFEQTGVRESRLMLGSHAGTHLDAESHMIKNGENSDCFALPKLLGNCQVLDLSSHDTITEAVLKRETITQSIILIKTRNSQLSDTARFDPQFVSLEPSASHYLVKKNCTVLGFDYLSIERNQPEHETHTTLMRSGVIIIEGLRLANVVAGTYFFICLPLKIVALDAAPARAILINQLPF